MQEYINKEIAARDNEIDRLNHAFRRETAVRKATADVLLNSFSQIENIMNSVKKNIGLPHIDEQ